MEGDEAVVSALPDHMDGVMADVGPSQCAHLAAA
jgi:hypothetical protein